MPPIDSLTRPEFNLDTAIFLAEASRAAYLDGAPLDAWANDSGLGTVTFFDEDNSQGFWGVSGEVGLLAFRGTSNIGQWIRDARFVPTTHPWGLVHRGFNHGFQVIREAVDAFASAAAGKKWVWVTGHSLGGAVALLAAARLTEKGIRARIHTFGQPKVGFDSFADRFGVELPGRLHRFINQKDIVPRLPPGFLYTHVGIVKRIVRPGVLEFAPAEVSANLELVDNEMPPLSEDEFSRLQLKLGAAEIDDLGAPLEAAGEELEAVDMFRDHAISEYVRLLQDIRDAGAP